MFLIFGPMHSLGRGWWRRPLRLSKIYPPLSLISLLAVALFLAGWRRWRRGVSPLRREPRQDGLGRQGLQKTSPVCGNWLRRTPRLSTYEVAAELSLPQTSILKILTDDLQFKNVLSVWVSHVCTGWGMGFMGPRREVWIPQDGQKPTTPHPKLTKRKTMVLMGFTCCPKRFSVSILPPGTTADRYVMIQYLKDTGHQFDNLKKNKIKLGELMLMWDNARPHSDMKHRPS